jgi:hypothetical protein
MRRARPDPANDAPRSTEALQTLALRLRLAVLSSPFRDDAPPSEEGRLVDTHEVRRPHRHVLRPPPDHAREHRPQPAPVEPHHGVRLRRIAAGTRLGKQYVQQRGGARAKRLDLAPVESRFDRPASDRCDRLAAPAVVLMEEHRHAAAEIRLVLVRAVAHIHEGQHVQVAVAVDVHMLRMDDLETVGQRTGYPHQGQVG